MMMIMSTRYAVQILLGLVFIAAGCAKLLGSDLMVQEFELIGLGQGFRLVVGTVEMAGGVCLFVPRAAACGAVLIGCVTIGATGAMVGHAAKLASARLGAEMPALAGSKKHQGYGI